MSRSGGETSFRDETLIALVATARDENGKAIPETAMLLDVQRAPTGHVLVTIEIPRGLDGQSFQIQAVAMNPGERLMYSEPLAIHVGEPRTDVAK